jgi:RHS repeat-associated protein
VLRCGEVDLIYKKYGSSSARIFNLPEGVNERTYAVKLKVRDDDRQYGYKTVYVTVKRPKHFYFYVKDHLGSTRAVVDEAGDVVEAYDYYPFGLQSRSYKEKGDPLTKETFTGKEQDTESNLHYFGARYYDAGAGRWLSVDPLQVKYLKYSPFNYTLDNPINSIDPNGKDVAKPTDMRILAAMRAAYRTSAKYRKLHNKIRNNREQKWTIEAGEALLNERARTSTQHVRFGKPKYKKQTTTVVIKENHYKDLNIASSQSNGTLANEATHVIEQSLLASNKAEQNYYNKDDPNNEHLTRSRDGAACTKEAQSNQRIAESEYPHVTEEDAYFENMSDEELDALMFNVEAESGSSTGSSEKNSIHTPMNVKVGLLDNL